MQQRISKRIAETRKWSRRKAEMLIQEKRVVVNGKTITSANFLVSTQDVIKIDNKVLNFKQEKTRLWLFNKPRGVLTTKQDPKQRNTIYNILPKQLQNTLYVGRLDYNSEGLLLLTNNGKLVNYLIQAKNNIKRIYKVKTFGKISQKDLDKLKHGITIKGIGYRNIEAKIIKQNNLQTWIEFSLLEGKQNEIRIICNYFNLKVSHLIRFKFGPFDLNNLAKNAIKEVSTAKLNKYFNFLNLDNN